MTCIGSSTMPRPCLESSRATRGWHCIVQACTLVLAGWDTRRVNCEKLSCAAVCGHTMTYSRRAIRGAGLVPIPQANAHHQTPTACAMSWQLCCAGARHCFPARHRSQRHGTSRPAPVCMTSTPTSRIIPFLATRSLTLVGHTRLCGVPRLVCTRS